MADTSVFISGLGLIGSSIARIIRLGNPEIKILGFDPDSKQIAYLVNEGIIDGGAPFNKGASSSEVIFLAGPVVNIISQIDKLAKLQLRKNVIITDVGSTKVQIMQAAKILVNQGITFIGGHPMAGSHLRGSKSGRSDLFSGAVYFLIQGASSDQKVSELKELLKSANVKWQTITAVKHDKLVAEISHVPHATAFALVNSVKKVLDSENLNMDAAAGGFKDTTRIAASDPDVWSSIFLTNSQPVSQGIDDLISNLNEIKQAIDDNNKPRLTKLLGNAQRIRNNLNH